MENQRQKFLVVGPGEVSGFNRAKDLLSGEGQIAPLIRNTSPARFPHLGGLPRVRVAARSQNGKKQRLGSQ